MTDTESLQTEHVDDRRFIASLAPRLPRMVTVTAVVVFGTFVGIQFIPQTFEARLKVGLPAGATADEAANQLLDQANLGEAVSRLSPDIIAEMRRDGGGTTDTTTLLKRRLLLEPDRASPALNLAAFAGTPARARAIVEATAASYMAKADLPPPLATESKSPEASTVSAAPAGDNTIETLQQRLSLAWEDRVKLEGRARRVEGLIAEGNYTTLAMDAENLPGLGRQLDQLSQLQTERDKLAINLLPNHPNMRTLSEEIDSLSADIEKGVQQLSALVVADRDAARRLEDGLRDQLAAAANVPAIDTSVTTGSVSAAATAEVTALPRPVRTDLALGLAGGLAFFGQIGLFALFRPRPLVEGDELIDEAFEPMSEMAEPEEFFTPADEDEPEAFDGEAAPAAIETTAAEPEHNWLASLPAESVPVPAHWLGQSLPEPSEPQSLAPARPETTARQARETVEIIALEGRGNTTAAARRLLARFDRDGKSVCVVDASSGRCGREAGISDLSLGLASFADIVHGSGAEDAALVPWGRERTLDAQAKPVRILIQALAELYDVVIITLDTENPAITRPLSAMASSRMNAEDVLPQRRAA